MPNNGIVTPTPMARSPTGSPTWGEHIIGWSQMGPPRSNLVDLVCAQLHHLGGESLDVLSVACLAALETSAGLYMQHVLVSRCVVYSLISWNWYTIDYCIVVNIAIPIVLMCTDPSQELTATLFIAVSSVGTMALTLKTKLLVHHWDALGSFWIHCAVLWITWALRSSGGNWVPDSSLELSTLMYYFTANAWLPWATFYLMALLLKSFLPFGLSAMPDLCQDFGQNSILGKCCFVFIHFLMAHLGALIGCVCYYSVGFHAVYLVIVMLSTLWHGVCWYLSCMTMATAEGEVSQLASGSKTD